MNMFKVDRSAGLLGGLRDFLLLLFCTFILTSCPEGTRVAAVRTFDYDREVFIINGLAETISVVNPETLVIHNDVSLTGRSPNQLLNIDNKIYVVNSLDNGITILDESTLAVEGEIDLGPGKGPWMIIPVPDSTVAYVTNSIAGTVSVIDLANQTVAGEISVGIGPQGGCYLDGKVYICNTNYSAGLEGMGYNEGTVSVIDINVDLAANPVETISVEPESFDLELKNGSNPQAAIAFPEKNEVHIILTGRNGGDNADDGAVLVLDVSAGADYAVKGRLAVGGSPGWSGGGLDEGRKIVYLTGVGGLQSYNYETLEILHRSGSGDDGYILTGMNTATDFYSGVAYDPIEDQLFVTFFSSDTILVLDGEDYHVEKELQGSDGPQNPVLFVE
ncbi:MAG: hypothetical protein JEY99_15900 [Spirochaetales bacterium]|nr:hypothetical protein [Spirochaetales bacterium]